MPAKKELNKSAAFKSTTVSSLYHHTTAEVLLSLFNPVLENKSDNNPVLTFRASESNCMNDTQENKIITGDLGLDTLELKNKFSKLKEQLNKVYIISFGKERDSIPMWKMYGGDDGIALRFGFRELKTFFHLVKMKELEHSDFKADNKYLIECRYVVKEELENVSQKYRKFLKDNLSQNSVLLEQFNRWQLEAISFKHKSFSYEKEYRIVSLSRTSLFQKGKYGMKEYREIEIPLLTHKEVLVSPLCKMDTKRTIETMCEQIKMLTGQEIKVMQSRLSLR